MDDGLMWSIHSLIFDDIGFFTVYFGVFIIIIMIEISKFLWVMHYPSLNEYKNQCRFLKQNFYIRKSISSASLYVFLEISGQGEQIRLKYKNFPVMIQ